MLSESFCVFLKKSFVKKNLEQSENVNEKLVENI